MSLSTKEEIQKKISKAKFRMMSQRKKPDCRFFSSLLAQMKICIVDQEVPTAATDGERIFLNRNFIDPLTEWQLIGLIMHELGHVIYEHVIIGIAAKLDKQLLNIAGDHYINLWLEDNGFELPPVPYYADRKYKGWSTMQIYKDLKKDPPEDLDEFEIDILNPGELDDEGNPQETTSGSSSGAAQASKNAAAQRIKAKIVQAATAAKMTGGWGSVPGDIKVAIEEMLDPVLPWHDILARYMDNYAKDDFSMRRANRRYLHQDLYLPSLYSEVLGGATFGVDVSGSMYGAPIAKVMSELKNFWNQGNLEWLRLMSFDTKVQMNRRFQEGESLDNVEMTGGGGTNVVPLLDAVRKEKPKFAIIMTDGGFATPNMDNIPSDIIWVIVGNEGWESPRKQDRVIYVEEDWDDE